MEMMKTLLLVLLVAFANAADPVPTTESSEAGAAGASCADTGACNDGVIACATACSCGVAFAKAPGSCTAGQSCCGLKSAAPPADPAAPVNDLIKGAPEGTDYGAAAVLGCETLFTCLDLAAPASRFQAVGAFRP